MAVRTITTRLAIDGETAFKKAMTEVNASLRAIRSEMELSEAQFQGQANTIEALTAKDKLLREEIAQQTVKVRALEQAMKDAAQVYGENSAQADRYRAQLNHAKAELENMNHALTKHTQYMKEARESSDGTASSIDGFGSSTAEAGSAVNTLASALAAAGVARGIGEITGAIIDCTKASAQFQSDITGVFKTVEGTDQQLAEIRDGIKQMSLDIPSTTTAISKVAESAGQLGIARENILDFTRVMIDLDETTDMTAENGAKSLARFANVTKMQAEDYSRLGSVIVDLGNNFATSESEITAMGTRLAAAGRLAKMTQPEILALGAAMSSVGLEAEAGGTAMTQTLTAMEKAVAAGGPKLEEFARIAGMSAQEFSAAWKSSAVTAVQAFISGLGDLDAQGESATLVLDELGLSGIRQSNMLKSLALASDQLTGAVDLANRAWEENSALAEEANKRYETTEAKMQMAANAAGNLKIAIGDALRPALGELAEAGADGFQWAAKFIEEHPWLVQALTGVTAALALYTAGLVTYTAAQKAAEKAQAANITLSSLANPYLAAAAAISGLIVALGAYSASLDSVGESSKELIANLRDTAEAYEDARNALRQDAGDVTATIASLEELAAVENKSAAQKAVLRQLVEELNTAIPELTLSYDEETDSLRNLADGAAMSAASIRDLAQAELERQERTAAVQRLTDLLREQKQLEDEMFSTKERLTTAQEKLNAAVAAGDPATAGLEMSVMSLQMTFDNLSQAYDEHTASITDIQRQYDESAGAAEAAAEEFSDLAAEAERLTQSVDTFSAALKEQAAQGQLSRETARALEEAGYAAALAVDEETGAVTLNRGAYIELAAAKINEQIASLETQRQSAAAADRLLGEAEAARHAGSAYWDMAGAKAAAAAFSGDSAASLDGQIFSLKQARAEIQSFTGASETAGRASSSRAKKAQTAAEADLETFKDLRSELDHQRNMEQVSQRDYYLRLKEYRDQYLTDEGNLSEYRRVTEQIFKYDKALADSEAALWAEQTETLVDALEDRVKGLESQRSGMEKALSGYGELFTVDKDDRMTLESIQEQIDAIDRYEAALNGLRERGIGQDLLDEVLEMGVDEATQYGEQLLAMSDAQWEQYNALWEEKQLRAAEVAEQFYKDQLAALETEYDARLGEALDGLTDTAFRSGADTAKGLIDGLASQEEALYAKARAMEQEVAKILEGAWKKIPSNAEIAASLNAEAMRETPPATAQDVRDVGSAMVNGVLAAERPVYVTVTAKTNLNGRTIAEETYQDLRAVNRANPETMDDT